MRLAVDQARCARTLTGGRRSGTRRLGLGMPRDRDLQCAVFIALGMIGVVPAQLFLGAGQSPAIPSTGNQGASYWTMPAWVAKRRSRRQAL
jgi:hypothetical protein